MVDTSTESDKATDLVWGPSHSEDDSSDSELTGTQHTFTENTFTENTFAETKDTSTTASPFFTREQIHKTWNFIEDNFGIFQCRGRKDSVSNDIEDIFDQGCATGSAGDTKQSSSVSKSNWRRKTSSISTPSGTATSSSLTKEKDDEDERLSPPRLRNLAAEQDKQRESDEDDADRRRDRQIPHKIVHEPMYLDDMDTFLSDEFTHMEQGFFNGVYDQICHPIVTVAQGKEKMLCNALYGDQPKSVNLSFDDTISKLTMEDGGKSASSDTLKSLERMKDAARGRSIIAAIVEAQSSGELQETAKGEAEAKAEQVSRFGFTEDADILQQLQDPATAPSPSVSQKKNPDNVIIVHFIPDGREYSDAPFDEDPYKATGKAHATMKMPSKSMRKRLLKHFKKKINKIKKKGFPSKDKTTKKKGTLSPPSTPPRNIRELANDADSKHSDASPPGTPGSRYSTTDPCSVTTSTDGSPAPYVHDDDDSSLKLLLTDSLVEQIYVQVETQEEEPSLIPPILSSNSDNPLVTRQNSKSPTVVEEVEVLPKRKEPVYTSYVKSPTHTIVEDVEVLRKESLLDQPCDTSDLATLKMTTKHRTTSVQGALATVSEEGGAVTEWSPYDHDEDEDDDEDEPNMTGWFLDDAVLPLEVQDNGNGDHLTACSSMTPSLMTMTSKLDKEREETDKLRIMLQKKDEDLERLRELLQMNESKAVIERIDNCSRTSPTRERYSIPPPVLAAS